MKDVYSFVMSGSSVIIVKNGHMTTVTNAHRKYAEVRKALLSGNVKKAFDFIEAVKNIKNEKVTVKHGQVFYGDFPLENPACDALLDMVDEGVQAGIPASKVNIAPLTRFLEKRSIECLWDFIKASKLTLLDDGRFVAYKKVCRRPDGTLVDEYTKTIKNNPGDKPRMERSQVNPDPHSTCSHGLHVCSEAYLDQYGTGGSNITVVVAVDPEHVVAVPADHNNAKMRVCEYEVLFVRGGNPHSTHREFKQTVLKRTTRRVVTPEQAIKALGLDGTDDPKHALRKRIQRGVTCRPAPNGMVELLDTTK